MSEEFEVFKTEFTKWQKEFGLTGYRVYFKYEPCEGFADIFVDPESMVATVRLNSELDEEDKPFLDVKRSAKHEAIHLLTNRLESLARTRYTNPDEIYKVAEELTIKLEELIK